LDENSHGLVLCYTFDTFSREISETFNTFSSILIKFGETRYAVFTLNYKNGFEKPYSENLSEDEINTLINSETTAHLKLIKDKANQI
jgi:hypothetical protein